MSYPYHLESDDSFDYLFKIVLIGDAGVGKTCVVQRFKSGTFLERQHSTIGVDFTMKTLDVDGKRVKVSLPTKATYSKKNNDMNNPKLLTMHLYNAQLCEHARDRVNLHLACSNHDLFYGQFILGSRFRQPLDLEQGNYFII